jgi:putative chitinase
MATDRETQLLQAAYQAGMTSPKELANFMAQVSAESGGLNKLEESFRYTKNISQIPVKYAHREGDAALETARVNALKGQPEELARLMYGGRNGNNDTTDGYAYRGRGYIQLTGKDNYEAAGKALHLDLAHDPDLAAKPENAAKIAVWYWQNRVPDKAHEDVKAATLAVNGGYNGLDTRQAQFAKWEKILTPETMQHLAKDEAINLSAESATRQVGKHAARETAPHSDDIKKLQSELAALGYKDGKGKSLKVDGDFGLDTRHAVERFQHDHHLKVDGIAGPATLKALDQVQAKNIAPHLADPKNPDHALYEQALAGVHKLDANLGRKPDQQSEQLAASLTVAARREGIGRIDAVALSANGSNAFAVQGAPDSPNRQIAHVPTAQAVNTPIEQSSQALAQLATKPVDPTLAPPLASQPSHQGPMM